MCIWVVHVLLWSIKLGDIRPPLCASRAHSAREAKDRKAARKGTYGVCKVCELRYLLYFGENRPRSRRQNFVSGSKDGYVVGDISWYVWLLELWKRRLSSTSKIYKNLVEGYIHVHLHPTGSVFYFSIEDMYGIVKHVIIYMLLPHVRQCSKIRGFFTSA